MPHPNTLAYLRCASQTARIELIIVEDGETKVYPLSDHIVLKMLADGAEFLGVRQLAATVNELPQTNRIISGLQDAVKHAEASLPESIWEIGTRGKKRVAKLKKLHWTQTPAGRRKIRRLALQMWRKRKSK